MKADGRGAGEAGEGSAGRCSERRGCQVSVCRCVHEARRSQKAGVACHRGRHEASAAPSCLSRGDELGMEGKELHPSGC